jgi:hypothetical protein
MNPKDLKSLILGLAQDISFEYRGVPGSICPFKDEINIAYGDSYKDYTNIDDVMSDPFWDGKALNEIAHELVML